MPIEIRELVIRAVVDGRPAAPAPGLPAPAPAPPTSTQPPDLDGLVARCVRDVLRELRRSRER